MLVSGLSAGISHAVADLTYVLDNGLKVILAPQAANPVISARVMVKAGSASESGLAERGLAHLMEHMAFKGTEKRAVGEVSSQVENNGGDINAYTSFDETVYYLSLPSDKLDLGLDILADLVFKPTYDPTEYAREKEVVIEEIRRSEDSPDRALSDIFFEMTFTEEHPYGHKILGSAETVQNASRETALAFHQKFYRPDNCVLIVTGGFDARAAKAMVAERFGGLANPATPLIQEKADAAAPQGPRVLVIKSKEAQLPKIYLGFRSPGARASEAPQLELLASVLSQGDSSRLQERVRYQQNLVTSVGSYAFTLLRGGTFIVNYETSPDRVIPALKATLAELEGLASAPPTEEELGRARALTAKGFIDRQEVPSSLGGLISSFELYGGDYRLKDAYLPTWARIGTMDLRRLASDLFRPENITLAVMLPEDAPDLPESELSALVAALKLPDPETESLSLKAAFETHVLSNGARVLVSRDATLPLVEIRLGLLGGRLAEKPGQEGLTQLMTDVWVKASTKRSAPEMARAIENQGLSIGGFSGRNSFGMDASFLNANWREGLSLFAELLTSPAFAEEDFQTEKEEQLADLKSLDESLGDRVFRLTRREVFRSHPYNVDAIGTTESVSKLTRDDLQNLYNSLVYPENLVFAVAGDIDPAEFLAALEESLVSWKPGGADKVQVPPSPGPLSGPVETSEALDRSQSHLALTFLAPGFGEKDQAALDVLNSIFSGMGGILFQELREKKSLAYGVGSSYGPGMKVGAFSFYIATAPDKTGEALKGILDIIASSREKAFDPATVEGAKTYLAGLNKLRRQSLGSLATEAITLDLFGLGQDFNDRYLDAIAAVTPADVLAAAQKYLLLDKAVLAVVGKEDSIQAADALF